MTKNTPAITWRNTGMNGSFTNESNLQCELQETKVHGGKTYYRLWIEGFGTVATRCTLDTAISKANEYKLGGR